jgi:hypothetical protein
MYIRIGENTASIGLCSTHGLGIHWVSQNESKTQIKGDYYTLHSPCSIVSWKAPASTPHDEGLFSG